jgi:cardiolipin synthase (CMP-forming)
MRLTLPTVFTLFRIALLPIMIIVFYAPFHGANIAASAIFIAAALTDWLDGWIARRFGMYSKFGEFLDPVADKLMVTGALLVLVQLDRVNAAVAFVIIGREIAISALREWMAHIGASKSVAVSSLGKIKTTAQMVAIPMLLYYDQLFGLIDTRFWGNCLLLVAAVLTVWSMLYYLRKAWPLIKESTGALDKTG